MRLTRLHPLHGSLTISYLIGPWLVNTFPLSLHLSTFPSSLHPSIFAFFLIFLPPFFPQNTSLILSLLFPTLSTSPPLALTSLSTFLPPFQHLPIPCLTSCLVLPFTRCTGTGDNFSSQPYPQLVSLYRRSPTNNNNSYNDASLPDWVCIRDF